MSIWIFNERADSSYDDIEGQAKGYPKYLANARGVQAGDPFSKSSSAVGSPLNRTQGLPVARCDRRRVAGTTKRALSTLGPDVPADEGA